MLSIRTQPEGISFAVHVQPRSSRNEIVGLHGEALKLKLTAPPVEGQANRACIELLAAALGVPRSDIAIMAGAASRKKQVQVRCDPENLLALRQRLLGLARARKL